MVRAGKCDYRHETRGAKKSVLDQNSAHEFASRELGGTLFVDEVVRSKGSSPMRMSEETPPRDETQTRWRTCEICGQVFDTTDVDQVFHHDKHPHEPIPSD